MADEKDTKAKSEEESAPRDTMHSGPNAAPEGFDTTANAAARELAAENPEPPANASVGSEQPQQSTISAGPFDPDKSMGTLVTDLPANDPGKRSESPTGVNVPNEAPVEVAMQPTETLEDAGKRLSSSSRKSSSRSSSKSKSK